MKIAVGADHAGFAVKTIVVKRLLELGHEVDDKGTDSGTESVDYPSYAHLVATAVADGVADRGVLVCGTGLGMCIAANRHSGVRAVDCCSVVMAEMSRRDNDANVLCLGGRLLSPDEALAIVDVWFATPYEGGRHAHRVALIEPGEA